jgi:TonB family protein
VREPADEVLLERRHETDGIGRMFTLSVGAHVALVGALAVLPTDWGGAVEDQMVVMTISLGGAPGAQSGGMTPMGGRPVQQVQPVDEAKPEPIRAPAAETPEMTVPTEAPRRAPTPPPVTRSVPEARGQTPTRGPEARAGSAVAETGAQGTGFGLSTGGGGTGGYLDVANFCCPEYLGTMLQLLQRNWNSRQEVGGEVMIKFTIQRDGRLTDVVLERSSGFAALDLSAQRTLLLTRQLPPLPTVFDQDHLTVHLNFQYQR